jgi:hypothetical protein
VESSQHGLSKVRRLRVFNVVAATLSYCARNAGPLFVLVWFPCVLAAACRLLLEWLIFAFPPRMPAWLFFKYYNPPTWLTAFALTPWEAMAWAFVLASMARENSNRGVVDTPSGRVDWLRFELSKPIVLAAAIFSLFNLLDGMTRIAQVQILVAALLFYDLSNAELEVWTQFAIVLHGVLTATVMAFFYLAAGAVLRTGTLALAPTWRASRGNRLRLIAAFLLLSIVLVAVNWLVLPVAWLARRLADSSSWTLTSAVIRQAIAFPFNMLWTVAWAVMVALVLDGLHAPAPSASPDQPATGAT